MTESMEGGAALAWRLLATLEGGSLLLAISALLAYTARNRIIIQNRNRHVKNVLITNTTNTLGEELKRQLELRGCTVSTVTCAAAGVATSGVNASQVDALVVVGSEPKANGLGGMADSVSEDVYDNLKLLESLSPLVKRGGCIAWACAGATSGTFSGASAAFDAVLHASLQHIANSAHCEPIWVGRCAGAERAAGRLAAELVPCAATHDTTSRFSIRNAAHKLSEYLCRWLKIVT